MGVKVYSDLARSVIITIKNLLSKSVLEATELHAVKDLSKSDKNIPVFGLVNIAHLTQIVTYLFIS